MRPPEFWRRRGGTARLLAPLGEAYALGARLRRRLTRPARAGLPVICIGNLVAGGAGKTPTALAVAERLAALGRRPAFLTRGYGGSETGPLLVDPARHDAGRVGDEALLLARRHPTVVARRRPAGAVLARSTGADVVVMDDGFQNPSLAKTLSLLVIDAEQGLGNGRVLPAGPLREPAAEGLARAQGVVLIGSADAELRRRLGGQEVLAARLEPLSENLAGQRVLAFAGIGRPEKFFATLAGLGAELVERRSFADHHRYRAAELAALRQAAAAADAALITTEKDWLRLAADERQGIAMLPVRLVFAEPLRLDRLLQRALADG
jgi:tetraacyldisaccharide 4'-kinase